jgi:hypothetical protein
MGCRQPFDALGGLFPDVDAYRSVAASIRRVDVNSWLSALPKSVVQPYARASSVESMLADIPVHPSVDVKELKASPNVRDRYQLGAEVTSAVSCAWISQWVVAFNDGDDAAAREAVDAMTTARDWTVLHEMNDEGGLARGPMGDRGRDGGKLFGTCRPANDRRGRVQLGPRV